MVANPSHSTASADTALPISFSPDLEYLNDVAYRPNYQDIKPGTCTIEDEYCLFKNNTGTVKKANTTEFEDMCLLWDPSCSGNRTLAMEKFFDPTFHSDLLGNACFSQLTSVNSVSLSNCNIHNPPNRMSEFREMKNWMRSEQCVSAALEWAAMTPINNFGPNYTFADAVDNKSGTEDPDSQIGAQMEDPYYGLHKFSNSSSCCGACEFYAENVDVYYWPEPDANTSCLSIIGESVRPLTYGATTTTFIVDPTSSETTTYWGCEPTSTFYNPMVRENVTYTPEVTTAEITTIGSLVVKVPLIDPWSSSPCRESGVISQGLNGSTEIGGKHATMHARDHTLIIQSSITQDKGLSPATTAVSGNFTL